MQRLRCLTMLEWTCQGLKDRQCLDWNGLTKYDGKGRMLVRRQVDGNEE